MDYLFHHAPGLPSQQTYRSGKARTLSDVERSAEIQARATEFRSWVEASSADQNWRYKQWKEVKPLLTEQALHQLSWKEAEIVVRSLNCMTSMPIHIKKVLNDHNNNLQTIRDSWHLLLHGSGPVENRMKGCYDSLVSFGISSVQELLGWFDPERFPLRNSNSDAGLRYFGYVF